MTPAPPALETRALSKTFVRPAVDALNLLVHPGEFYILLGANGAGKTTTLRMIAGLLPPDSGDIFVHGTDARADPLGARRKMAWLSDEPMIYEKLSPLEYLDFVAGLWGVPRAVSRPQGAALLDMLGLAPYGRDRCESLSKGMRQKVALAGALVHDPKLIILDEPLTGLDAGSARVVKAALRDRLAEGAAVIMTTHILDVAERMADRIGVIDQGRLIAEGTMAELRRQANTGEASLEDVFLSLIAPQTPDA